MLSGVHLLLTYRCTHECEHCFVFSSPRARGTFTLAGVVDVLDQARAVGSVEWIYFEGGEPFLYYPLLLAGLEAAADRGFRTGVVTNAFWAEHDAELWLRPLAERGVADLAVSDDAFHETPGGNAVEAARRLGIPVGTISIPQPAEGDGVQYRGRAADKLTADRPLEASARFTECPHEDLRDPGRVHVDAFGNVHLCQGLLLGNCFQAPLSLLLERYDPETHPVVGPILRRGPAGLADETGIEAGNAFVDACHLCYRVRERLAERFPGLLGPEGVYGKEE